MQSCRVLVRGLSRSAARPATKRLTFENTAKLAEVPSAPGYKKVMDLQKLMCADDGLLVWQKRGMRDMLPYYLSMIIMTGGVGLAIYNIYRMSMPKKQD